MIKIGIAGCAGRMGRALIQETCQAPDLVLTVATVSEHSQWLETDVGTLAGLPSCDLFPVKDLSRVIQEIDILIDFTTPSATLEHLALCVAHHKKMVIGTTGLTTVEKVAIEQASYTIPIVYSPNMSIGLNVCLDLVQRATHAIGTISDVHISEAHHRHKKDSPSGTSLKLEEAVHQAAPTKEVAHSSIRAGNIVGEHTILFALEGETIEITHRAQDRNIFAKGAIRAAQWLSTQSKGLYSMRDVLKL